MADNYVAYTFDKVDDVMVAMLSMYPFASFEEKEESTIGYIAQSDLSVDIIEGIASTCTQLTVTYVTEVIEPQNWNAQWEASFQPVEIDKFCRIRADFHEKDDAYEYDIIINPKMAFGTGHHETTYMVMQKMSKMNLSGKSILDFGCGTGVLAILAEKLGAAAIDAIDIEEESYLNTKENAEINGCQRITAYEGVIDSLAGRSYDAILANINRHVLLTTADTLFAMLNSGGNLLMSGILKEDFNLVVETYTQVGFKLQEISEKGDWTALLFEKR